MNVESGAGLGAKFRDDDYVQAGAKVVDEKSAYNSDILLKVRQPLDTEIPLMKPGSTLISFLYPSKNKEIIDKLAERKVNAFSKLIRISSLSFLLIFLSFRHGLHSSNFPCPSI